MKRSIIFLFIVLFAVLMLLAYTAGIRESRYYYALSVTGQVGMAVSLLLFFIADKKKKWKGDKPYL